MADQMEVLPNHGRRTMWITRKNFLTVVIFATWWCTCITTALWAILQLNHCVVHCNHVQLQILFLKLLCTIFMLTPPNVHLAPFDESAVLKLLQCNVIDILLRLVQEWSFKAEDQQTVIPFQPGVASEGVSLQKELELQDFCSPLWGCRLQHFLTY